MTYLLHHAMALSPNELNPAWHAFYNVYRIADVPVLEPSWTRPPMTASQVADI